MRYRNGKGLSGLAWFVCLYWPCCKHLSSAPLKPLRLLCGGPLQHPLRMRGWGTVTKANQIYTATQTDHRPST
jgi:hypothetical protein